MKELNYAWHGDIDGNEKIVSTVKEIGYRNDRLLDVLMKPVVPAPLEFNDMIEFRIKEGLAGEGVYSKCL